MVVYKAKPQGVPKVRGLGQGGSQVWPHTWAVSPPHAWVKWALPIVKHETIISFMNLNIPRSRGSEVFIPT